MLHDNPLNDGGPAFPGTQYQVQLQPDETRSYHVIEQPMNGMSVRDIATLQILGAMIQAHRLCTPALIIEAFDAADVFLELRSQV
ncbi:MAG: hypothetical protein ACR2IJ_11575 [Fluviibacter sp.]